MISKADVQNLITTTWLDDCSSNDAREVLEQLARKIEDMPSVQQPVGHWEFNHPSTKMICTCSVCGGYGAAFGKDKYCPNCGAKMAESEEKE